MSKESFHTTFQKGEEFLLFFYQSLQVSGRYYEGVSDFWRKFSELNKSTLIAYRNYLIGKMKPATVNLRIWTINLYTRFLSNIFTAVEDEIIKPKLQLPSISPNII